MKIREIYDILTGRLQAAGIENYSFEVKQLLSFVLCLPYQGMLFDTRELTCAKAEQLEELCTRRCEGYPLQYLLGEWEFYGYPFYVGDGVLIPRQDTETLCETAIRLFQGRDGLRIMDLCSGSGCIAVTLRKELPTSQVYAMEFSEAAYEYLLRNIAYNSCEVKPVFDDVLFPETKEHSFDLITCNPPYLNDSDMACLQREVTYEPRTALYAPDDGMDYYRKIPRVWKGRLRPGGILMFEAGAGQADRIARCFAQEGYQDICIEKDLCGIERIVYARKQ